MKKILIPLFFICNLCYSQFDVNYDLYLILDSKNCEISVYDKMTNNSVEIKTFAFGKHIPKEDYKYSFSVDNEGKINKVIKGATNSKNNGQVMLFYYSNAHKEKKISKLSNNNIINYSDFLDSEFNTFMRILKDATTIYIIDLNDKKNTDFHYNAYEVTF